MTDLNDMECVTVFDRSTKNLLYHQWTFILTPEIIGDFTEDVFPLIEVELLKGSKQALSDGRTKFQFRLDDRKTNLFKQMLLEPIFVPCEN